MGARGRGGISLSLLLLPLLLLSFFFLLLLLPLLSTWLPKRLRGYPWVGRLSLLPWLLAPRAA